MPSTYLCAQLTRDLFAIAKFLFCNVRYGVSNSQIFAFCLFFLQKTPNVPFCAWPTSPGVTLQNASVISYYIGGAKMGAFAIGVFLRRLVGELGTPKLAQFFAWEMLVHYTCT